MDSVLIVSCSDKGTEFFFETLKADGFHQIAVLNSCNEAREILLQRNFDLLIVNSQLPNEPGEEFSRQVASKGFTQVMLAVDSERFDTVSAICEDDGVLTIAKPIGRTAFWQALKLAKSAQSRLKRAHAENAKLKQKIEDIRIVDRAKCLLISQMNMREKDAHRFIEKQAMDMRRTRREIAEGILKTYEM